LGRDRVRQRICTREKNGTKAGRAKTTNNAPSGGDGLFHIFAILAVRGTFTLGTCVSEIRENLVPMTPLFQGTRAQGLAVACGTSEKPGLRKKNLSMRPLRGGGGRGLYEFISRQAAQGLGFLSFSRGAPTGRGSLQKAQTQKVFAFQTPPVRGLRKSVICVAFGARAFFFVRGLLLTQTGRQGGPGKI